MKRNPEVIENINFCLPAINRKKSVDGLFIDMCKLALVHKVRENILIDLNARINTHRSKSVVILCIIALSILLLCSNCYSESQIQIIKVGSGEISFQR